MILNSRERSGLAAEWGHSRPGRATGQTAGLPIPPAPFPTSGRGRSSVFSWHRRVARADATKKLRHYCKLRASAAQAAAKAAESVFFKTMLGGELRSGLSLEDTKPLTCGS